MGQCGPSVAKTAAAMVPRRRLREEVRKPLAWEENELTVVHGEESSELTVVPSGDDGHKPPTLELDDHELVDITDQTPMPKKGLYADDTGATRVDSPTGDEPEIEIIEDDGFVALGDATRKDTPLPRVGLFGQAVQPRPREDATLEAKAPKKSKAAKPEPTEPKRPER